MSMPQRGRILSVFLGSLCLSATLGAAVPAYEPFAYNPAPTLVNGKNGGTGWGGAWVGFADNVVAPGLTYPGLTVSGNALGPTPGSASTRALATPIAGASGTSMVLSALIRSNTAGTPASQATLG